MFTMTYGALRDSAFFAAMRKLADSTHIKSPQTRLSIAKVYSKVVDAWKESDRLHQENLKICGKKDADGKLISFPENPGAVALDEAHAEEYTKLDGELKAIMVTFNCKKIPFTDLDEVDLSAADIVALEPVLESEG